MEAEYIVALEAKEEAVWIKSFTARLGVIKNVSGPVSLFCDNTKAIAQAKRPRSHKKSKYVPRKYQDDMKISYDASDDKYSRPINKA